MADLMWSVVRTMDTAERRWEVDNTMKPPPKEKDKKGDA